MSTRVDRARMVLVVCAVAAVVVPAMVSAAATLSLDGPWVSAGVATSE